MKNVSAGPGDKVEVFLDTNVLIYAYDLAEPVKQRRALEVIDELVQRGLGVISTQVLAEFFTVSTSKMKRLLTEEQAQERVTRFARIFRVLPVTETVVLEAIRGVRRYRFSYWDAQIWAVARMHQIPLVFTEDFAIGSTIEGVHFVNPFAEDFHLETVLSDRQ